jgi:hypothetical protein
MTSPILCLGKNPVAISTEPVAGCWTQLDGEDYYQISSADRLRPFFMSVVSASDLWMFISSTGALTAGRRTPDLALFPYATDDKIHDAAETTGSKTLLIVQAKGLRYVWEPFSERQRGVYQIRRSLYKNTWGNKILFEECNEALGLTFRYGWFNSSRFGFVRRAWIVNNRRHSVRVRVLDGLQNLMPTGVGSQFQTDKSTLLDAYKRSELQARSGLALFRLSSIPIDRPEPAEALRTSVAWSLGLPRRTTLLSSIQVDRFRQGLVLREETDVRAERGAFLIESELTLRGGAEADWWMGADVDRGAADVVDLDQQLMQPKRFLKAVIDDVERGCVELEQILASADGLQRSARVLGDARHGNNVLFNVMRGGVFADGYSIDPRDFEAHVRCANREVAERHAAFLRTLKPGVSYAKAVSLAAGTGDASLERLAREYLPLTFSRRHGDPSRPWNRFSIVTRAPNGRRVLNYEGNWRDIFQNWEALAVSFPEFLPGMISRFVSASTADGYNPYRITRDGIDWEVPDPHDPWAHIGYWGDHQLIYLLKFLEMLQGHQPAMLAEFLEREVFAYADVPYRIKPYDQVRRDPKETVDFDPSCEARVRERVGKTGSDGKLVHDSEGQLVLVNLTEKLLVALLSKLSNFIPEAGIWLNTQRPEWNDANNALVGNGVSVVTLCHLRRYLAFCLELLKDPGPTPAKADLQRGPGAPGRAGGIRVSLEVRSLLDAVARTLKRYRPLLAGSISDADRDRIVNALGKAGGRYRGALYSGGFTGKHVRLPVSDLRGFLALALEWADHSIRANRRDDGLYHAYNLARFSAEGAIPIRRLYQMLEGQVAVLSSGTLWPGEAAAVLHSLRGSAMYRADQHSYLLYPNRSLPRFTERNNLPVREVRAMRLPQALAKRGDRSLVEQDVRGGFHFSPTITNAHDVRRALDRLAEQGFATLVRRDSARLLGVFEQLFDHESFTGRSGTFFAYEGLGSIYWHMVSKLLLAVQESFRHAADAGAPTQILAELAEAYQDVRRGLGDYKGPAEYGAFPADPYSHTPGHCGARQPGLTGQVKEDILCRMGELGIVVSAGCVAFRPQLLQAEEFLADGGTFRYRDLSGVSQRLRLPPRSLAFTYCQVPVIYRLGGERSLTVRMSDGSEIRSGEPRLDPATSRSVHSRAGTVGCIVVGLEERAIGWWRAAAPA